MDQATLGGAGLASSRAGTEAGAGAGVAGEWVAVGASWRVLAQGGC